MKSERVGFILLVGSLVLLLSPTVAGAQADTSDEAPSTGTRDLEQQVEERSGLLERRVDEVSEVGAELEEAQRRTETAQIRVRELGDEVRELQDGASVEEESAEQMEDRYGERARAAYQGEGIEGVVSILEGMLGAGDVEALANARLGQLLSGGREDLEAYRRARADLRNTRRQLSGREAAYDDAISDERGRTRELRSQEKELEESIARLGPETEQLRKRLRRAERQAESSPERQRVQPGPAVTDGSGVSRESELRVAREEILVRPVEPISGARYERLYKEAARMYGFPDDWYVLAAIGKVESDHGRNMGPSSAGAMGPMQFLPSTWRDSGVDGDGDGQANVMDPEDAIPAAAGYLKAGGAPEDWYAALFSYNRADWYVKKVLAVAEAYRRLEREEGRLAPYL